MIRILIVDDQALLCEVLKTWLEQEEDFQIVGNAKNGKAALEKVEILHPDLVLMDIEMPEMDGITATRLINQQFSDVKVIVLSANEDYSYLTNAYNAGAKDFLQKNNQAEQIVLAVRAVYQGETPIKAKISQKASEFVQIPQQIREYVEEAKTIFQKISDAQVKFEQCFERLETELQFKYTDLNDEINNVKQEAHSALEDITRVQKNFSYYLAEFEMLKPNLKTTLDELDQAKRDANNSAVKNTLLSVQINENTLRYQNLSKRYDSLRNYVIVACSVTTLTMLLLIYLILESA